MKEQSKVSPEIVFLDGEEGFQRLRTASISSSYLPLANVFVSEKYLTFCSIASSVMALNALKMPSPPNPYHYPYNSFTELNIFTAEALRIKSFQQVDAGGLVLAEFSQLLSVHGVLVEAVYADSIGVDEFRSLAISALQNPNQVILVNLWRESIWGQTVGHVSPLAAYDESSDSFLFMDVARYKFPPAWIPTRMLCSAMNTIDPSSQLSRGLAIVSKPVTG